VRCCPTGIDIRDGLQMECIACAECVDACRPIMLKVKKAPDLVGYFWGDPGRPRRLARPAVLALLAGVALAAGATAAAARSTSRDTFDLTATALASAPPAAGVGGARNVFDVSLENRARAAVTVRFSLGAPGLEASLRPEAVDLAAGEHKRLRLVVTARGPVGRVTGVLSATAAGDGQVPTTRTSPLLLVIPEPR
jgi:polyferredoxin